MAPPTDEFLRRHYVPVDEDETFFVPKTVKEQHMGENYMEIAAQTKIPAQSEIPDQTEIPAQIPVDINAGYDFEDLNKSNVHYMPPLFNIFNNTINNHVITDNDNFMFGGGIDVDAEVRMEMDLCGAHKIIKVDVSHLYKVIIELPSVFIDRINEQLKLMKAVKIQFGVITEWVRGDEFKLSTFSNTAKELTDTFIPDGISELTEKIENMAEQGSGWQLVRIMEIFFILTKVSKICRLSGSSYIETPPSLASKKAIINVQNDDLNCFLYSVLSLTKKSELGGNLRRVSHYQPYIKTLYYRNIVIPLQLKDMTLI